VPTFTRDHVFISGASHRYRGLAAASFGMQDIGQLTALVRTRLRRMQYRPGLLRGFLAKTRLDLTSLL
jgi:hypothetical protein